MLVHFNFTFWLSITILKVNGFREIRTLSCNPLLLHFKKYFQPSMWGNCQWQLSSVCFCDNCCWLWSRVKSRPETDGENQYHSGGGAYSRRVVRQSVRPYVPNSCLTHNFVIWSRILQLFHRNDHHIETTCRAQHLGGDLECQGHLSTPYFSDHHIIWIGVTRKF